MARKDIQLEGGSDLGDVQSFWDSHPCEGDWDAPDNLVRFRYTREPYLPRIIDAHIPADAQVLEVGCGQGVDLVMLAKRSKRVTAIDLTSQAVARAKRLLSHFGLKAKVSQGNAEHLPFTDRSFDAVYSYGVLHHTADTQGAIDEVFRVLKPGGVAVVMLYRSPSLQFVVVGLLRLLTWPFRRRLASFLSTDRFRNSAIGTSLAEALGVPILKAYTAGQVRRMFSGFSHVSIQRYQTGFTRLRILGEDSPRYLKALDWLEDTTRNWLGFFNVIVAKK